MQTGRMLHGMLLRLRLRGRAHKVGNIHLTSEMVDVVRMAAESVERRAEAGADSGRRYRCAARQNISVCWLRSSSANENDCSCSKGCGGSEKVYVDFHSLHVRALPEPE